MRGFMLSIGLAFIFASSQAPPRRPSSARPATASPPFAATRAYGASIKAGSAASPTGPAPASRSRESSAPRLSPGLRLRRQDLRQRLRAAGGQGPTRPYRRVREVAPSVARRLARLGHRLHLGQALLHVVADHLLAVHHQAERLLQKVMMGVHGPGDGVLSPSGLKANSEVLLPSNGFTKSTLILTSSLGGSRPASSSLRQPCRCRTRS